MKILEEQFGIRVARDHTTKKPLIKPLPSYEDTNFRVTVSAQASATADVVLKIHNKVDSSEQEIACLHAQDAVLSLVKSVTVPAPFCQSKLLSLDCAKKCCSSSSALNNTSLHFVRVLEFVPGSTLNESFREELLIGLGQALAGLDQDLENFIHPGAQRDMLWDVRVAPSKLRTLLDAGALRASSSDKNNLISECLDFIKDKFSDLENAPITTVRKQVIHGDANDCNGMH